MGFVLKYINIVCINYIKTLYVLYDKKLCICNLYNCNNLAVSSFKKKLLITIHISMSHMTIL